jgi:hypothetical protein
LKRDLIAKEKEEQGKILAEMSTKSATTIKRSKLAPFFIAF